mmetsp:Transcript_6584/g.24644  ORF Transcript_6584/g.24644 Transcript_6584/m.24644 type:complete len:441 (-) Transcript_6584:2025-3347(-)
MTHNSPPRPLQGFCVLPSPVTPSSRVQIHGLKNNVMDGWSQNGEDNDIQNWEYFHMTIPYEIAQRLFKIKQNSRNVIPFGAEVSGKQVGRPLLKKLFRINLFASTWTRTQVFVRVRCEFRLIKKYEEKDGVHSWVFAGWWHTASGEREMFSTTLKTPKREWEAGDCFEARGRIVLRWCLEAPGIPCFQAHSLELEEDSVHPRNENGVEACVKVCAVIVIGQGNEKKTLLLRRRHSDAWNDFAYRVGDKSYRERQGQDLYEVTDNDLLGMTVGELQNLRRKVMQGFEFVEGEDWMSRTRMVRVQNTKDDLVDMIDTALHNAHEDFRRPLVLQACKLARMSFDLTDAVRSSWQAMVTMNGLHANSLREVDSFEYGTVDLSEDRSKVIVLRSSLSESEVSSMEQRANGRYTGLELVDLNMLDQVDEFTRGLLNEAKRRLEGMQ